MEFLNEDKRRFSDLTDEEQGLLLLAWHKGLQIEYWDVDDKEWNDQPHIKDCTYSPFFACQEAAFRIKPEPVKEVHWCNDYTYAHVTWWVPSRKAADAEAAKKRIAVIRREIVDGVVNYYREEV